MLKINIEGGEKQAWAAAVVTKETDMDTSLTEQLRHKRMQNNVEGGWGVGDAENVFNSIQHSR